MAERRPDGPGWRELPPRKAKLDVRGTLGNVPEVLAARRREPVCVDIFCTLSGDDAHAGDCEPCSCGLEHAAAECLLARAAGWSR